MKPGDIVQLKSGGPLLTVERINLQTADGECVKCVWITDTGEPKCTVFFKDALKLHEEEQSLYGAVESLIIAISEDSGSVVGFRPYRHQFHKLVEAFEHCKKKQLS